MTHSLATSSQNQSLPSSEPIGMGVDRRESVLLAPYAMHCRQSAGREHHEPEYDFRSLYQRDRDRIIHSAAFRRLSDKTQVFTGLSDYHRTRLTHTMEVASIARTIGRALRLNEDLIEALALLHDIGHPPFGHAGEDVLDAFAKDCGGFSHNTFALTLVQELERPYADFHGLNLTREVLDGQKSRANKQKSHPWPLLEAQIVDLADSISYDAHDLDDAVKLGWLRIEEVLDLPLVRDCHERVVQRQGPLRGDTLRRALVRELVNSQVVRVLTRAQQRLAPLAETTLDEVRRLDVRLSAPLDLADQQRQAQKQELEQFLFEKLYRHRELMELRQAAQGQLEQLANKLLRYPELLPASFQTRSDEVGHRMAVVEHLACMTDRYAHTEFQKHVDDEPRATNAFRQPRPGQLSDPPASMID